MKLVAILTAASLACLAAAGSANAQTVLVSSGSRAISLPSNQAMVTFVPTNAITVEGAMKNAALSAVQGQAVAATLLHAVPIPIVGPFAGPILNMAINRFRKPVTGFSIAFLKGTSAGTAAPAGQISFTIPSQSLEGATPTLLRMKASQKDSTRIVRSLQLSVKASGATVTPDAKNAKVLGVEEDVVACSRQESNGNLILTPKSPLEVGEYAIALVPSSQQAMVPIGSVWDFRVEAQQLPAQRVSSAAAPQQTAVAAPPRSISIGQSSRDLVSIYGQPVTIARLGAKEVYVYRDLKVTLVNDKVTDAE